MSRTFIRSTLVLAAAAAGTVILALPGGAVSAGPKSEPLSKHDRALLADARANDEQSVSLLLAASPGASGAVADGLAALGADLRYRDDDLDYLRAEVPLDRVEDAARLAGVAAANVDELIPFEGPSTAELLADEQPPEPEDGSEAAAPTPVEQTFAEAGAPPTAATPAENAYMPTRDVGAPQFAAANPTFDGRGVTIAILDSGIDLLTPELQTAKTLDGQPTRKIVDWVTATDPVADKDPTWVAMANEVTAAGSTFEFGGKTYTAPADGAYRLGFFDERSPAFFPELGRDVNRDGNPAGSSGIFPVLWNATTDDVWVDANQNGSFADEPAMTDYKVRHDVGVFGTDRPSTPVRDTMPFVVQVDGKRKLVNIGIVASAHGTHVAGIAAGKGFFGGAMNGAAPEAQLVSVRVCMPTGCTEHALLEGMIYAQKQANADIVNLSVSGLFALNDANNVRTLLYDRLSERYKAQIFVAAGNFGPGLNTVGDPSQAKNVISVGAYVNKDTWLANYGAVIAKPDGIFPFSSRGPSEEGGFKPNLLASGAAVSTIPAWATANPIPGGFTLPRGYAMQNGTSMASPQAAGAAALLASAAKQTGAQWKPAQLRQALASSARYLPHYGAYEQGNGLLRVGAAWELLQQNIKTVEIASEAPVATPLAGSLAKAGRGVGIHERDGWFPGSSGERTISLIRSSGGSKPVTYQLSWTGNDGTFTVPATVDLPHNVPVALPVSIAPAAAGAHSAILNVDDPQTTGVDYQLLNTVIAAERFTAANGYTVTRTGRLERGEKASFFFAVPAEAPAVKIDLSGTGSARLRYLRIRPDGTPLDSPQTTSYLPGSQSRTMNNLTPGVWEVTVDLERNSSVNPATFTLSAALLGASVSPSTWTVAPAAVGTTYANPFTFTNRFGAFSGGAFGGALASTLAARPTITAGQRLSYDLVVPAGSGGSIAVSLGRTSDPAADLDLYLYQCTATCTIIRTSNKPGSSEESASVLFAPSGRWKVVVDAASVPSGTTEFDYVDAVGHPSYGSLTIADPTAVRAAGSSWTRTATVKANVAPAAGRFFQGSLQVRTGGIVLGSATVDLRFPS